MKRALLHQLFVLLTGLVITSCEADDQNQLTSASITNYEEARPVFWSRVYPKGGETFYCARPFKPGYNKGINIEHVFPMSWVAWKLKCGTRKQCRETSAEFNRIEADMHNLYPARADINEIRSSHPFGEIPGEQREFGHCDFEIDERQRIVEPKPDARGNIARAMFYMADRYDLIIHKRQYKTLQEWDKEDPVDAEERRRNQIIKSIQGNGNSYIK